MWGLQVHKMGMMGEVAGKEFTWCRHCTGKNFKVEQVLLTKKHMFFFLKRSMGALWLVMGEGGSYEHGHGHMVAWVFVVGFIHNINSCTQVQASLYLMEVVGDGGEAITPPFPIVLPKKLRCFRNKRTTCQRFSSKQTCEETNVERWGDDKCKRWI